MNSECFDIFVFTHLQVPGEVSWFEGHELVIIITKEQGVYEINCCERSGNQREREEAVNSS